MKFFKLLGSLPAKTWGFILLGTMINTVTLYHVSFYLLEQPVFFGDDSTTVIQASSIFHSVMLNRYPAPSPDTILLINTSYDNQLVDHYNELAGSGNIAITDRQKLLEFFKLINQHKPDYTYIMCDIAFVESTPLDAQLAQEMENMKIVIPYDIDDSGKRIFPNEAFNNLNMGLAQYHASSNLFTKFTYGFEQQKSMPVLMYENIHKKSYQYIGGSYKKDGMSVLNNSILNFRLRYFDITESKQYKLINLGNLIQLPIEVLKPFLSGKIIVMGDFTSSDMHNTVVGNMPGPLLLLNAYYGLEQGDNVLTLQLKIFLMIGFFILSFFVFLPSNMIRKLNLGINNKIVKHYVKTKLFTTAIILIVISLCSYALFGVHVNILLLLFWMVGLQFLVRLAYQAGGMAIREKY